METNANEQRNNILEQPPPQPPKRSSSLKSLLEDSPSQTLESQNSMGSTTSLNSNVSTTSNDLEGTISKDILEKYLKDKNKNGFVHPTNGQMYLSDNQIKGILDSLNEENITLNQVKTALKDTLNVTTDNKTIKGDNASLYNATRSDLVNNKGFDTLVETEKEIKSEPMYAVSSKTKDPEKYMAKNTDVDASIDNVSDEPPPLPPRIEDLEKQKTALLGNANAIVKTLVKMEESKHWGITNICRRLLGITTPEIDRARERVQEINNIDTRSPDASSQLAKLNNGLTPQGQEKSQESPTLSQESTTIEHEFEHEPHYAELDFSGREKTPLIETDETIYTEVSHGNMEEQSFLSHDIKSADTHSEASPSNTPQAPQKSRENALGA